MIFSKNKYVGIFACRSSKYSGSIIKGPITFSVKEGNIPSGGTSATGLANAAYQVIFTLMLSEPGIYNEEIAKLAGTQILSKYQDPRDMSDVIISEKEKVFFKEMKHEKD